MIHVDEKAGLDTSAVLENNKRIMREFLLAADRHDGEAVRALLHVEHRLEYPGTDEPFDRDGHWRLIAGYHAAFPDMIHRPDIQVAEGDRVVTRGTIFGTHLGPIAGAEPTGRQVVVKFMNMTTIRDGQICGMFSLIDGASLQQQLGGDGLYREGEEAS